MGYKILGYVTWQGVKLYARRNLPNGRRNLAIAGATAAVVGTAVAATRQQSQSK
jgi:hypothetical protein